jgi:hypothetical protein
MTIFLYAGSRKKWQSCVGGRRCFASDRRWSWRRHTLPLRLSPYPRRDLDRRRRQTLTSVSANQFARAASVCRSDGRRAASVQLRAVSPFLDCVCRAIDAEDVKRQTHLSHGELDRWISKLRDTWRRVVRQTLPTASVGGATDVSVALEIFPVR